MAALNRPAWTRRLVGAALVAVAVGAVAAAAARGVDRLLEAVVDGPRWWIVVAPALGLVLNSAIRHWPGRGAGAASVDTYIEQFHDGAEQPRKGAAQVVGAATTVGLGGALDIAGLGVALGSTAGGLMRRWMRLGGPELLVVGAAAGLGATLQAPVCGAVLAIELPYRHGAAWRRLPAALIGSIIGFIARGLIDRFALPFRTDIGVVGLRDVLLAVGLAVLAGFASRLVAALAHRAQAGLGATLGREWHHVAIGGAVLAGMALWSLEAFDEVPVSLGPGATALAWAASASTAGLCALVAVRAVASGSTVLGRGGGGLFIPLIVLGLVAGHVVGDTFDGNVGLLSIIGAATLLGAGYRVPLGALVWIAESTHSVPAVALGAMTVLVAASVGGGRSVSTAQRSHSPLPTSAP